MTKYLLTAAASALALGSCQLSPNQDAQKPNIVIILTDDQGWGDFGLNGNTQLSTPNLDALASQGVRFNNFYVCPVCAPTRAEMLTGRYSFRTGATGVSEGYERINPDEVLLPEILGDAGYVTGAFGKWHNGTQAPYHPNTRGFDEFYGFCSGHWGNYFDPILDHNGEIVKGEGYITDDVTTKGIEFMENNRDQPFFLYLPLPTPHSPMQVPDRWYDKFKDWQPELPNRYADRENLDHTRAALAMCENIDWNVGRVLSKLEELNLDDNTIVMFFTDNGPNGWRWNGGMRGIKGSVDEGGLRTPLLVSWPGKFKPGLEIDHIAGAIDLLPTLHHLAGLGQPLPNLLDGLSLKPLLYNESQNFPDRVIMAQWGNRMSIRSQKYRLDEQNRLYDIENDRGQENDISLQQPDEWKRLNEIKDTLLHELNTVVADHRNSPFSVGHKSMSTTLLPARDGQPHGAIQRSNQFPNSSFFTNWSNTTDSITWHIDVMTAGLYLTEIYYTLPHGAEGTQLELSFHENNTLVTLREAHNPPLTGMENDRFERLESYVKDFKPITSNTIRLMAREGFLTLKSPKIEGDRGADIQMILMRRLE